MVSRSEMEERTLEHFQALFAESDESLNSTTRNLTKRVTTQQNSDLEEIPTYEEIKKVVMTLNPDKILV